MARPGLDKNTKFRALCRILGEPRPHVRGYLECIWETAYETGNPVIGDQDSVEAAAEYPGERGRLFGALLACGGEGRAGFIEPALTKGMYQIHDLFDHAPEYVQGRLHQEEERKKAKRCDVCKVEYRSRDPRSKYCSPACRTAAWRKRGGLVTDSDGHDSHFDGRDTSPAPAHAHAPAPILKEESKSAEPTLLPSEFTAAWNAVPGFVACKGLTGKRARAFQARARNREWVSSWTEALEKAGTLPFCLGHNDRGWRATVDWFLRPDTVTRILEGCYDSTKPAGGGRNARPTEPSKRYNPERDDRP